MLNSGYSIRKGDCRKNKNKTFKRLLIQKKILKMLLNSSILFVSECQQITILIVRLVNGRIIETINLKRSGGTQTAKRRDNLMGFDVAGIIKLLSNKTKLVSPNLIPIINDFFTSAEEFALVASNRDNDGRIKGLSGDINPLDLTVMLNAMSRYNIKIKPEFVQLISVVLEPS